MRQADKKYFGDIQQGRLNADDSPFVVGSNEWVNAENIRTGSTDKGFTGIVESIGGNSELPQPPSAKAYFPNIDFSSVGGYFELGTSPSTSALSTTGITNTNPVSFLTNAGEPGIDNIEAGDWNFYIPLSNFQSTTTPRVYVEVYIYPLSGVPYLIGTSNTVSIENTSFSKVYNFTVALSSQTIIDTDRFFIKLVGENITGISANVVVYPQNGYVSNWSCYGITNLPNTIYDYTTIGSVEDTENNRIVYFNYDNSILKQDRITCLDLNENKQYNVLLSSQVISNKYLNTEYVYDSSYTTNTGLNSSILYNMVFNSGSKTITITYINYNDLVDINLNIGDQFHIYNTISNNNLLTVSNIVRNVGEVVITVLESLTNETSTGNVVYLNQLKFAYADLAFLNSLSTGFQLEISNSTFPGTYTVQAVDTINYIVYINEKITNIGFLLPSDININSAIIIYNNGLNFDRFSLIHSAKISNLNILSFPDGINNEPRKINIESGILANDSSFITTEKKYEFPLNFSEIALIKAPPAFPPVVKKEKKSGATNFIRFESFEFAFQFVYNDNEITVPGTYSLGTRLNSILDTEQFNAISISMSYGQDIPSTVKRINLICRISDGTPIGGTNASIIYKWNKSNPNEKMDIDKHNNNLSPLNYIFYNDIAGEALPSDDVLRPFDNVPIFSQTHEVSKSRYFLANNTEGYNTPTETSLYSKLANKFLTNSSTLTLNAQVIKIGYYKWNGNNWSVAAWYVWINNVQGQRTGYYVVIGSENYHDGDANANIPAISLPATINFASITWVGMSVNDVANYIQNKYGRSGSFDTHGIIEGGNRWGTQDTSLTDYANTSYGTIANNSKYRLGIVFYDYAMRKCGVCINNNNPQNYYNVINNTPFQVMKASIPTTGNYIQLKVNASLYGYIPDIIENDILSIVGTTHFNEQYTVLSVYKKFVSTGTIYTYYTLEVSKPIASITTFESGNLFVWRNQNLQLTSPIRDYNYTIGYGQIEWDLNNVNNLQQIPDWAYYYSIVKTLDLKTRFFLESNTGKGGMTYVQKNTDGTFNYGSPNNSSYTTNAIAIGINTTNINYAGLGYTYSDGDMCTLIFSTGQIYNLPVIGQYGNYIHLQSTDIGSLAAPLSGEFQIFTPYKTSEQEPYFEFAQTFPISNPGTPIRSFSQTQGLIPADSYILHRNAPNSLTYYANAMCPNDTYWKRWDSDAGKTNIITTLGQTDKNTNITWSDTYVSSTQINGSSTFRLGSETFVSDDCGSITKLQLTSKVQDQGQGSVMLALCNSEINSMYLGETQITDSTGKTQFFSASQGVISTINVLKGNYGCISPESVVQYRGKVYFVDLSNGRVIQYSDNGLDAISNIKMSRFWKNWSYKYQSMTKAEIEAYGDRPFIFSMVDSGHDELLISLPKLSNTPPKGFLPDYPSTVYPFDILDYQGKTIVYCLGTAAQVYPHWQGSYTFTTENFVSLQNRLFSFKNGKIYEHNQETQNTFYGTYSPSSIMFTSNILSQVPKVYDNFVSESNLIPNFVYFYNDYPYIQTSDLDNTSFINLEGIWYANILRNKIVPTSTGFTTDGLLTAEVMRNTNMYVQTTFSPTTSPLELRLVQLGTSISRGHTIT